MGAEVRMSFPVSYHQRMLTMNYLSQATSINLYILGEGQMYETFHIQETTQLERVA
jgi:hypothetical protein